MNKLNEKKFTTSKKIMWVSILILIVTVIFAVYFSYKEWETTVFAFILPITGGIAGATVVAYMNKSKMENIFRYKISFLEYKLDLIKKNPKQTDVIEGEMSSVETALDLKVDNTMQEAINEDIEIQSY